MPLYEYACPVHGATEALRRYADRDVACCGQGARTLSLPSTYPAELTPYYDRGLGVYVESRAQRRDAMRALGVAEKGTSAMHGAKGTIFSQPGQPTVSVPPSGAFAPRTPDD